MTYLSLLPRRHDGSASPSTGALPENNSTNFRYPSAWSGFKTAGVALLALTGSAGVTAWLTSGRQPAPLLPTRDSWPLTSSPPLSPPPLQTTVSLRTPRVGCKPNPEVPVCPQSITPPQPIRSDVGVCMLIRNEWDLFLDEYRAMGIGAIHIWDHYSRTPLTEYLPYRVLAMGDVTYEYITNIYSGGSTQKAVYIECIEKYASDHRWLFFIDADELPLLFQGQPSLPAFLRDFEEFGGVAVNRRELGSSNHTTRPPEGVRASYTNCYPADHSVSRYVKIIANTKFLTGIIDPHQMGYHSGKFTVDENFQRVNASLTERYSAEKIGLNHYVTQCEECFERKRTRGDSWYPVNESHNRAFFGEVNEAATDNCFAGRDLPTLPSTGQVRCEMLPDVAHPFVMPLFEPQPQPQPAQRRARALLWGRGV
jgi:hypothetical protein